MTQSSMPGLQQAAEAFFFVLQPNETGDTRSHQAGEVHVRKSQIGGFFPDLSSQKETADRPIQCFHAQRGEVGQVTFTSYGNRYEPESRLRKFPPAWRSSFETDRILVVVPVGDVAVLYFLGSPGENTPSGLEAVWEQVKTGKTHGRFLVAEAAKP